MPRHPVELAQKHYKSLPAVLKQALFSVEIAEKIGEIGKKFGLTIEQTGIMAEETGYIMLGLSRPNELIANLANELGLGNDKAQDLAAEVNHQIFFPLREELKRTHSFDVDMSSMAGHAVGEHVPGMELPASVKKTFVEEKSPLVGDLTRVTERTALPVPPKVEPPPKLSAPVTFEPTVPPTGRVADLHTMEAAKPAVPLTPSHPATPTMPATKPPLPVAQQKPVAPAPPAPTPEPKPIVLEKLPPKPASQPVAPVPSDKPTSPLMASAAEPWEKDMEKEVVTLLNHTGTAKPVDLRPQQKPVLPEPPKTKVPPIDLRKASAPPAPPPPTLSSSPVIPAEAGIQTKPSAPQSPALPVTSKPSASAPMTPQLQDLRQKNEPATEEVTLLTEKMRREKITPKPATPATAPSAPVPVPPTGSTQAAPAADADPYREPIE